MTCKKELYTEHLSDISLGQVLENKETGERVVCIEVYGCEDDYYSYIEVIPEKDILSIIEHLDGVVGEEGIKEQIKTIEFFENTDYYIIVDDIYAVSAKKEYLFSMS